MSNLEEKKLRDEELEKEIEVHSEKLEEEMKLGYEKLQEEMKLGYEKLQEEMKLKNNELESNDKQDKELEKKIKDMYDGKYLNNFKFYRGISPNDLFKGAPDLKIIADNWPHYNKIEITEEEYSELSKDYGQLMLNNIIDRIIEKTYDEIDNISQYSNEKKTFMCIYSCIIKN